MMNMFASEASEANILMINNIKNPVLVLFL